MPVSVVCSPFFGGVRSLDYYSDSTTTARCFFFSEVGEYIYPNLLGPSGSIRGSKTWHSPFPLSLSWEWESHLSLKSHQAMGILFGYHCKAPLSSARFRRGKNKKNAPRARVARPSAGFASLRAPSFSCLTPVKVSQVELSGSEDSRVGGGGGHHLGLLLVPFLTPFFRGEVPLLK